MPAAPVTRRRLLLSSVLACGLAGCSGAPGEPTDAENTQQGTDDPGDGGGTPETTRTTGGSTAGDTPTPVTPADASATATSTPGTDSSPTVESTPVTDEELDLREANVVGVAFSRSGGSYRFEVTLYHDDVHESGALVSQPEREAFW